jgi:hypothetical protein
MGCQDVVQTTNYSIKNVDLTLVQNRGEKPMLTREADRWYSGATSLRFKPDGRL